MLKQWRSVLHILIVNKMEGCGHINTACHVHLPKKTKVLATKGLLERQSMLFIKVSGRMHNN